MKSKSMKDAQDSKFKLERLQSLISFSGKKTNIVLADQAFVSAMHFLIGILLARYLGMTGYGEYVLAYGAILFFSTCQNNLIISPMMVKMPIVSAEEKDFYFLSILAQQLLFNCVILIFLIMAVKLGSAFFSIWRVERLLWATSGAIVAFLAQDFIRKYFFVVDRPLAALINDICSYGLQVIVLLFIAITFRIDTIHALWILAATSTIAVILGVFQANCFRRWKLPSVPFLKQKMVEHLQFGKWLLGGDLMYWAQNQFVNYFCAGILSIAMVGAMNATRNVTGVVNILFLGLMNFLPPRAAGVFVHGGSAKLNSYLLRVSFWGGLGTLAITLVASFGREFWLNLLYGNEYAGYGWIVIWWSAYCLIGFFMRPLSVGLQVLDKTRSIFFSNLTGFILMLSIIYPLLVKWQIHGLMLAICVNNFSVIVNLFARYRKFSPSSGNEN